jgi:Protein of unknown function (DUF2716)
MRELDTHEYTEVWKRFDSKFCFRPSVSESAPGISEPIDSITFRLAEKYEDSWLDELQLSIFNSLQVCNAFKHEVYYLDWQHASYLVNEVDGKEGLLNGFPDGDYAIFLDRDMSIGTFGHPWEYSICVFGEQFVISLLQNKPRILDRVIRNRGGYTI